MSYPHYIHEVLEHAGLFYDRIDETQLAEQLGGLKILLTVGGAELTEEAQVALRAWVEAGGAWLAVGDVLGAPDMFGLTYRPSAYGGATWGGASRASGEGYLRSEQPHHPVLADLPIPLHFFNGVSLAVDEAGPGVAATVLATCLDSHGRPNGAPAVVERAVGAGSCFLIAPDVTGTIVRIQQGVAVTRDGLSAPDNTATVCDGVLKCDDGAVLDWHFDRQDVLTVPGLKSFREPIADHWRSLVLRALFYLAQQHNVSLTLLWLYPRNLPALAHMSFDSDLNDPDLALELLRVTGEADVHTTWCVILPGYEAKIITAIRESGHELAVHYDAIDHPWNEAEWQSQLAALTQQFGEAPVSNKNHYTRWEGDTEFFEWCQRAGIAIESSKGPSKSGEAGFLFGSCQTYFPLAPDGTALDVLELPFQSADLEIFLPPAVVPTFIGAVLRAHGVLHQLFHPAHIAKPGVAQALAGIVAAGRAAGMEWWTARQINDWERARRAVRWQAGTGGAVSIASDGHIRDATLLLFNPPSRAVHVGGAAVATTATERWGFPFLAVTQDIEAQTPCVLGFR